MITDEDLARDLVPDDLAISITRVCSMYNGQIDDLYSVVGMVVIGRLFGWRVVRLTARRGHWTLANRLFGDFKVLMPERGPFACSSLGLYLVDKIGDFWEVIRRGSVPAGELRKLRGVDV